MSSGSGQTGLVTTRNDLEILGLKGNVKSVTEEQCRDVKTTGGRKICKVKQTTVFNADGYKVEEQTWEFSELIERKIYVYTNENRLQRIDGYRRDNTVETTYQFKHDQRGNVTEETIFDENNQGNARYTYQYDGQGRKIQMDGFDLKTGGNPFIKERFTYDSFGNLIRETSEHASGNSSTDLSYTYDKGRIAGKTIRTTFEKSGTYSTTIRYEYDRGSNVIAEHEMHNGRKSTTIILFDNAGNWVRRTTTESKDVLLTTERIVEYF